MTAEERAVIRRRNREQNNLLVNKKPVCFVSRQHKEKLC